MNIIRQVRKKNQYPKNMKEKIIQHEEEMLKYYSEIITEKYGDFFQRSDCGVELKLIWGNDFTRKYSEHRNKFVVGYTCNINCEIKKKGKTIEVFLEEEDIGWYPLVRSWTITRIDFPFNKPPYYLFKDIEEIYEDMDEFQELLCKKVSGIS